MDGELAEVGICGEGVNEIVRERSAKGEMLDRGSKMVEEERSELVDDDEFEESGKMGEGGNIVGRKEKNTKRVKMRVCLHKVIELIDTWQFREVEDAKRES